MPKKVKSKYAYCVMIPFGDLAKAEKVLKLYESIMPFKAVVIKGETNQLQKYYEEAYKERQSKKS